jgi:cellulose synthase/poly-beta-1,6-N-acetylglucosamine synthase-like glycosyltransferase
MLRDILIYISAYIGLFAVTFYVLGLVFAKKEKPRIFPEKNPPMVSIIIPAWNEAKGIAGTIKSALNLNYPKGKLEIIVVDDGSTDNTYEIASKFKGVRNGKVVKVFKNKKNMGKGVSMNVGISKSKGEIIVTMDADNVVVKGDILKTMISSFTDPKIMCVAPTTAIYKPKGILQRIQQVEYMLGVFLRKSFSDMNSIHITSGAFSVYKKEFFDKHGGFSKEAITEDMEMALRIQAKNYKIVNNLNAIAFTVAPNKFVPLMKQRRRWYTGLLKCLLNYRRLFSKKYGAMGVVVLPVAIITVILSVILTAYLAVNSLIKLKKELILWRSINFNVLDTLQFNSFVFERYLFLLFSTPVTVFAILFILILLGYMIFAKKYVKEYSNIKLSLVPYILFYAFLFSFWWLISFFYTLFNKKVVWR